MATPTDSATLSTQQLLELDSKYCSFGDTVHYYNPPKIFSDCDAAICSTRKERPISICRCGTRREFRLQEQAPQRCAQKSRSTSCPNSPVSTCTRKDRTVHAHLAVLREDLRRQRRVHYNVGGSQAIEDAIKVVRNATGRNLNFAFQAATTAAPSAPPPSPRAIVIAAPTITSASAPFCLYPYCFRCKYDKNPTPRPLLPPAVRSQLRHE